MKNHGIIYLRNLLLIICFTFICVSCGAPDNIRDAILNERQSYYYVDFKNYPLDDSTLPVGIFDSGTGGLSVLDDIIDHEGLKGESFTFLGDLANMPYGLYAYENNTGLLIEHIMKDVQFMLGNKYYRSAVSADCQADKRPVKAIVIACNTATAYGLDTVRNFLKDAGLGIGVIGVIDAGAEGAFGNFSPEEEGTIAVMATDGTVRSGAYPEAIKSIAAESGRSGRLDIFQQAGIGIAESIDESIDFIDRSASAPREAYKGPSENGSGELKIDTTLMDRYKFNMENGAMLFDGTIEKPGNLQINSVENYISFNLVSLMEKIKASDGSPKLNSVVLACTHYPFFEETFINTINRLRDLEEDGEYVYRSLISEDFIVVNPAKVLAEQLYQYLNNSESLNKTGQSSCEFYISVPNKLNKKVMIREDGSFTYEYKYGRIPGDIQEYVKIVPFSRTSIPADILNRLSSQIPVVYDLMVRFNSENPRTEFISATERISNK